MDYYQRKAFAYKTIRNVIKTTVIAKKTPLKIQKIMNMITEDHTLAISEKAVLGKVFDIIDEVSGLKEAENVIYFEEISSEDQENE